MVASEKLCLYFCVFYICQCFCSAAVVSKLHGGHEHLTKEREGDGPYSPKESHPHYDDSGEHHNQFDHEAILGSSKEAEEYDNLPPEEAKKRLGILLKKMDTSLDGFIDSEELKAWILKSFGSLAEEEVQERIEDLDLNGDGLVSWNEYITDTYGEHLANLESVQLNDDNYHLIREDREMWQAADKNGDNILDLGEFRKFHSPEDYPDMTPLIINQTLRTKDKDNDGAVNFQEFVGEKGPLIDKEHLLVEQNKFEHDYDKNKDGVLTGQEILYWIVPSNEDIADEEVIHLFASSDDDHDDLLSFKEVLEHHDIFVGSEATDYGDHLHNIHHLDDEL